MADKKYKLMFNMSDGSNKDVQFTVPQGPKGEPGATGPQGPKGDIDDFICVGSTEPSSGPILWFSTD